MKPRVKAQDRGTDDLFRSKLKNIVNLGDLVDWARLEAHFAPYYCAVGRPGSPTRLWWTAFAQAHRRVVGRSGVRAVGTRFAHAIFSGVEYFQHAFPLERSGMTHFRNRVWGEALEPLLQETLAAAHAQEHLACA
ncbi:MAG: hypothetical protein ACRD5K_01345 [Candidatus Acidiferrales bacterium]